MRQAPGEPLCALLAVIPEIAYRHEGREQTANHRWSLATTPREVQSSTEIDEAAQRATFTAQYQLAAHRTFWNFEPHPHPWQCTQRWTLAADRMQGRIELQSLADQHSPAALVRIRFGLERALEEVSPGVFRYGPLELALSSEDFVRHEVQACPPMYVQKQKNATELLLYTARGMDSVDVVQGQTYSLDITLRHHAKATRSASAASAGQSTVR